MRFNVF